MNVATDPAKLDARPLADPPAGPAAPAAAVPPTPARRVSPLRRRLIEAVAGLALLAGAAYAGYEYWTDWRFEESTDDAYVQADIVPIAPQVSGYLITVNVTDNQPVRKDDVLAVIDPRDYQAAVAQAEADVAEARATIDSQVAQLNEQQAVIAEARAQIDSDQAALTFAQQNDVRFTKLAKDGYGPVETAQQTASQIAQAQATLAHDMAALDAAQKQVAILDAQLAQAKASLGHNEAALDTAKLNLGYTELKAPVDGVVGARTLRVGQFVEPGNQLLAVVPLQATYIIANYKETQLTDVKPGQPVSIAVDTFPGVTVRGFVTSLAPASGQEFALLPPDNATGNFTKIVQRIPVRVDLDPTDPLAGQIRPGMSVTTTIRVDQDVTPAKAG
ncbi:putative multidrug resistance protein EmrK [Starkeya nomas]|uniref:Putative multidrug resistance protein EmrK n=1 Tax=Starkeya nomas TaxID=2666134 RepID=A0A5S9PVG9_9HYPH|nr:HlyD family secretion protein [Starkeya nomas]CAA0108822.1 putative multidrug resistance protein EmrK [Starkeya nomas]